jgi:hypothetical protein
MNHPSSQSRDGVVDVLGLLTNALLTNSGDSNQAIANIQAQLNATRNIAPVGGTGNSGSMGDTDIQYTESSIPLIRGTFNPIKK